MDGSRSAPWLIPLLPFVDPSERFPTADSPGLDQEVQGTDGDGTGSGSFGDAELGLHQFAVRVLTPLLEARLQEFQGTVAIVSVCGAGDRPVDPEGFREVNVGVGGGWLGRIGRFPRRHFRWHHRDCPLAGGRGSGGCPSVPTRTCDVAAVDPRRPIDALALRARKVARTAFEAVGGPSLAFAP